VTFALTGGSNSVPSAGDLVIVTYAVGTAGRNPTLIIENTSGTDYTDVLPSGQIESTDTFYTLLRAGYRFMPGTPETQVRFSCSATGGSGNAADAAAWDIIVLRGVDTGSPLDKTSVEAEALSSHFANPPSITPVSQGAWTFHAGASGNGGGTFPYASSDLSDFLSQAQDDTNDIVLGAGLKSKGWTSGAQDPAVFTRPSAADNGANSWAAFSVAIRPIPAVTHTAQATLTGNSTVSADPNPIKVLQQGQAAGTTNPFDIGTSLAVGTHVLAVTVGTRNAPATGVTWNGVALTQVAVLGSGGEEASIWLLANPATGSHTLSIATTGSGAGTIVGVLCLKNVDTGTPVREVETATGATSITGTLTGPGFDDFLLESTLGPDDGSGTTPTKNAGQTLLAAQLSVAARGLASYKWSVDNDVQTLGYTTLRSEAWRMALVALQPTLPTTATIVGTSAVTAVGAVTTLGAATLAGATTTSLTGTVERLAAASLGGQGVVDATGVVERLAVATITGQATVSATGQVSPASVTHTATATLAGTGAVAPTGQATRLGAAMLAGTGTVSATGSYSRLATAALAGAGAVTATGQHTAQAQATLSGSTATSFNGYTSGNQLGQATLAGAGALLADGVATRQAAATMAGTSTVTAISVIEGTADLFGIGSVFATATLADRSEIWLLQGETVIAKRDFTPVTAIQTFAFDLTTPERDSITNWENLRFRWRVNFEADGLRITQAYLEGPQVAAVVAAQATLSGSGAIVATGTLPAVHGQATISGQGTVIAVATPILVHQATAILAGQGAVVASGSRTLRGQALIIGVGIVLPVGLIFGARPGWLPLPPGTADGSTYLPPGMSQTTSQLPAGAANGVLVLAPGMSQKMSQLPPGQADGPSRLPPGGGA
jgi:hypothetical protein